jgi:PAS domain S-box-containing protein
VAEAAAAGTASGRPFRLEYRILRPDGETRWLRSTTVGVTNDAGEVARSGGIIEDVTEAREAAGALAENERRLREIVDTAFATTVLVDEGRVVYANKRIAEIFGYDVAEADGLPFAAFFPPAEGERVLELLGPEAEYEGEHRGVKKDGTPMWLRVRSWPLAYGGRTVRVVYLLDITALREALEGVRASEERYALAQRAADIGSWDWDVTTGGLLWSDTIEPMFGFGPGEFGGTYDAFLASVHPDDRDFVVSSVNAAVNEKREYDIEHRIVWPDGTVRWVSEKGEVFYDAGDKPVRMLGVVGDITTRKEAQENLKRALAETEQRRAEIAALLQAARAVLETPRFEAAARAIYDAAQEAVGAAAGYIALLTPDGTENEVVFLDTGEVRCEVDPELPMPIRGFREVAIRAQKPVYENDFGQTSWVQYLPPGHAPLQNVLFAPLNIEGKTVGLLGLGNKPGGFTANDALVAGAFADFAAVALQNYRNLGRLEASEERYRRIVETAEEGIWMVDENNDTVFVNRKMVTMLGYGERELLGQPFLRYVEAGPPAERAEELRRRGVVEQRDLKLRRRDGTVVWGIAVMSPIFDDGGRYEGALMMITDITERKRAEEALREAELRYRSLFEQSPDGVLVLDPETMKPREFNEAAARQLGYTPEEFAGLSVFDYEAMESAEDTKARLAKLRRQGRDDFETLHRTKTGEILNVFVTTKMVNIDGRRGLYTIFRDLTPLKRAEQQLVATAAELARSNRDLEQFAYAASHDLQEPLRMVSNYLQLLERRYGARLDGDAVEFLNYAVDGARRMAEMVQDLLNYSRVGSRGTPFAPTDLNAALDQALADLQVAVEETGARVTRDELPTVAADASQMRQLFQNLMGNAIKFRGPEPPQIHVGAERRGGEWRLAVRDNGIGIAPEFRDRIFGVFQRLHSRGEYPGTGIGLAICEKIVTRHGGRIWVEAEPGRGATFYFTLPARGEER